MKMRFCQIITAVIVLSLGVPNGLGQIANVAYSGNGATCSASSSLDSRSSCDYALDAMETPVESEWISDREGAGAFIDITFDGISLVSELKVLQRCFYVDMARQITVRFSDSTTQTFELSCEGGGAHETDCGGITWSRFPVSPVETTSAVITISESCYPENYAGFREIVVFGVPQTSLNLALASNGGTCEASSSYSTAYTCDNAIDNVVDPGSEDSWDTDGGDNVGAWIKITLPNLSVVNRIRMKNRCLYSDQMSDVRIDFDGGVSRSASLNCYDGGSSSSCPDQIWDDVSVADVTTTSVTIVGVFTCPETPSSMGFQEVEIYGRELITESGCPFNFTESDTNPAQCYRFVHEAGQLKNVTQAKSACVTLDPEAHLVEITSMAEQQYLITEAERIRTNGASCTDYYMGGRRISQGALDWYWERDFVLIPEGERYWGPGEPVDNGLYMSFRYYSGNGESEKWQWAAVSGTQSLCYICQKTPVTTRTQTKQEKKVK